MKPAPRHPDEARDDGMRAVVLFWARFQPKQEDSSPFILPSEGQAAPDGIRQSQEPAQLASSNSQQVQRK